MFRYRVNFAAFAAVVFCFAGARACHADLRSEVNAATARYKDLSMTCVVLFTDKDELAKIGKDFAKSFEIKSTTVKFKLPDKMTVEGKLGMVKLAIVTNGDYRRYKVPSLGISKLVNIKDRPEQGESDLDLGILSSTLWNDYEVTDVEEVNGEYKVTFYRPGGRDRKLICWVDVKTLKLLRLERYQWRGPLDVKYVFSGHFLADGVIWVPRRVDIYTPKGALAAITECRKVKVNSGIPDSAFKT